MRALSAVLFIPSQQLIPFGGENIKALAEAEKGRIKSIPLGACERMQLPHVH